MNVATPLNLNLHLLASAHHSRYPEALRRLSLTLGFVQTHPSFDPEAAAEFPMDLDKLTLEIANADFHTLNNVWAACGAKYQPSVLLKVRMLTIDQRRIERRLPRIDGIEPDVVGIPREVPL